MALSPIPAPVSIVATIATRGRPDGLLACLASLAAEPVQAALTLSAVVIENEEEPTDLADRIAAADLSLTVRHIREPRLGIPMARNAGVEAALEAGAAWVWFLDDDEWLDPGGLDGVARVIAEMKADVIAGPVFAVTDGPRPDWMPREKFDRRAEGAELGAAATGNTLARAHLFQGDGLGLRFDEALAFTGGSDVEFFRRAVATGAVIRWSAAFPVREHWGAARLTMAWHLKRKYREASVAYVISTDPAERRSMLWAKGVVGPLEALGYGAAGLLAWPFSARRSERLVYKARARLAEASAMVGALTGRLQQPYRETPKG
jgi:succinoglycan biosynthesis protein ExoM